MKRHRLRVRGRVGTWAFWAELPTGFQPHYRFLQEEGAARVMLT